MCPNTAASQRVSIRGGCGKGGEQFVGSAYFALVKVMRLITSKPALFRKATYQSHTTTEDLPGGSRYTHTHTYLHTYTQRRLRTDARTHARTQVHKSNADLNT